ncbi:DNA-processing protein DprA [Lachnospiraceae bacterium OttesenSCG-928-D06]|nr:DNA-processing protein DprA [Lachnospiraceae bacterium OttesenSCG-928-D06]
MDKLYEYWLSSIPGVGNHSITKLLNYFKEPKKIYHATQGQLSCVLTKKQTESVIQGKESFDLQTEYNKLEKLGIQFITKDDLLYPNRLREIPDAPYCLFVRGRLPSEQKLSVAVIGARDCSEYGKYIAKALGETLAKHNVQVISGLARGIDGISQEGALQEGGESFGILGCGVDICYPKQNQNIYNSLLEKGGIISTYHPGTKPKPSLFPPRNRIVSGLSDVIVVIEARQKSGTLITVDMALEQGREVYAVPGRITDRLSDGCNKLIKQGAGLILSPEDFVKEIKMIFYQKNGMVEINGRGENSGMVEKNGRAEKSGMVEIDGMMENGDMEKQDTKKIIAKKLDKKKDKSEYNADEILLEFLDFYPKSIGDIYENVKDIYSQNQTFSILVTLCILGKATQVSPGHFIKKQI